VPTPFVGVHGAHIVPIALPGLSFVRTTS